MTERTWKNKVELEREAEEALMDCIMPDSIHEKLLRQIIKEEIASYSNRELRMVIDNEVLYGKF